MRAEGVVVRSEAGLAHVSIQRSGGCGRCHEEGGCGGGADTRCDQFVVLSEFELKPGDRVVVEVPEGAALRAAILAYGLPLLLTIVGAAGAQWIFHSDLAAPLGALAGLGVGFLCLRRARRRGAARPRVADVLS